MLGELFHIEKILEVCEKILYFLKINLLFLVFNTPILLFFLFVGISNVREYLPFFLLCLLPAGPAFAAVLFSMNRVLHGIETSAWKDYRTGYVQDLQKKLALAAIQSVLRDKRLERLQDRICTGSSEKAGAGGDPVSADLGLLDKCGIFQPADTFLSFDSFVLPFVFGDCFNDTQPLPSGGQISDGRERLSERSNAFDHFQAGPYFWKYYSSGFYLDAPGDQSRNRYPFYGKYLWLPDCVYEPEGSGYIGQTGRRSGKIESLSALFFPCSL